MSPFFGLQTVGLPSSKLIQRNARIAPVPSSVSSSMEKKLMGTRNSAKRKGARNLKAARITVRGTVASKMMMASRIEMYLQIML